MADPQIPHRRRACRSPAVITRRPNQPWTIAELAAELRVSDQYLYNKIRDGKVEVLDLDGLYRIADPVARRLLGWESAPAAKTATADSDEDERVSA
jgi:hypothetical protein